MRILRSLAGPLLLALAVWCAAGAVALPTADDPTARVIVLAPLWVAVAGGFIGWLLPGTRHRPPLTMVLTMVPWLPVSLPAVLQLWTGRLAWVPVAVSVLAALPWERADRRPASVARGRRLAHAGLAALLTAVMLLGTAWVLRPVLPGGDEPNYLIITQSLLKDGDLRIENNHQAKDYANYFSGTLSPDFIRRGRNEVIYSIHAPGLPVLVAPLFAAFGYRGAQATVMALAALTGAFIWLAGWRATRSERAAWFAWASVAVSVTFLVQGVTIFPDGPAAAVMAGAVLVLLAFERRDPVGNRALVVLSAGLAALPFLHTRFVTVSAGVAIAVLWALVTEPGASWPARRSRVTRFLILPLAGLATWFGYFEWLYGTPNPSIPYGTNPDTHAAYIPGGVLGLFFDQEFGLLAFSPVLGAAIVGWMGRRDATVAIARPMLIAAVLYLAAVGTYWMWWAGVPAPPARLATVLLPAFAPALAVAWHRAGAAVRTTLLSLLAATAAISVVAIGVTRGVLAWNVHDAQADWLAWMGTSVNLARAVPSFFWNLNPGVASSEWPFTSHVIELLAAIVVIGAMAGAALRLGSRRAVTGAWAVVAGAMLIAQIGWWHNGTPPLEPSGPQLAVLRAVAEGQTVLSVKRSGVSRRITGLGGLAIEVPRNELATDRKASWADLDGLPAGDYDLTVALTRATGGKLTVQVGADPQPQTFVLDQRTEQTFRLSVLVAGSTLHFEPDETLASSGQRVALRPVSIRAVAR